MTFDKAEKIIRAVCAALGTIGGFFFGELDGLFFAVVAVMAADYVTGVIAAAVLKRLSSSAGFRGIVKKLFMITLIALGHIIDAYVIGQGAALMTAVELFFLANESLSICENAGELGLPIPKKLREMLAQLKNDEEDKDNNGD